MIQKMHKLASMLLREVDEFGIIEMKVTNRVFDLILHEAVQSMMILGLDDVPVSEITINVMGRPVVVRRETPRKPRN